MEKNKTGKPAWPVGRYLKYAIGEIILVVLGILIALQINNWNENRLTNKAVESYLNNLLQELENEQDILDLINSRHSFKYYSMQYLLKMEGSNLYDPIADRKNDIPLLNNQNNPALWNKEIPEAYNKEFIQIAFSLMHRAVLPPFPKSTLSELKSTGMYSKLNSNLKKEIDNYYRLMENNFNGKPQILAMDFQASLAREGFITTDTHKLDDPISLLKNNPERIGLIKRMIRESGWTVQSAIESKAKSEELIKLIEMEIAGRLN
jgi:hypothetical protein